MSNEANFTVSRHLIQGSGAECGFTQTREMVIPVYYIESITRGDKGETTYIRTRSGQSLWIKIPYDVVHKAYVGIMDPYGYSSDIQAMRTGCIEKEGGT